MAHSKPSIVFGAGGVSKLSSTELTDMLSALKKYHVKELDTAYIYPESEAILGKSNASKDFTISTKAPGFVPGALEKQSVIDGMNKSLKDLGVSSVDIYYLHFPHPQTPIEETLSAIQQLYAEGKFKRFGLSNYSAAEVQRIYDIQAATNSVLPSVYQGNYNAVSRHIEDNLFPTLRKLKISFYAYSPIGGGFLVKDSKALRAKADEGRFKVDTQLGDMYNGLYSKESLLQGLDEWEEIAKEAGISKAALAYRWVVWNSVLRVEYGDAVIVGASKIWQLEETLKAVEDGPLGKSTVERIEGVWRNVKADAPVDNYISYFAGSESFNPIEGLETKA